MIAVALYTVAEMVRRRFVLAALLATLAIAILTAWGFTKLHGLHHPHGNPLSPVELKSVAAVLLILIAYLFSFVLAFAAALVASPMLTTEVDSGVLLPILARPISRTAVLAGKALGLGLVLCVYAAFAAAIEIVIVRTITGYAPPHPVQAVAALCALALVMLWLTLALGTRLPMIAACIVSVLAFGVSWMAGIIASIGPFYNNHALVELGVVSQLLLPSDAMWRLAVYQLEPVAILANAQSSGTWQGPFFVLAPPPWAMLIWTGVWLAAVFAIAARSFSTRDV